MFHSWTFQKKASAYFALMASLSVLTAIVTVYALRSVVSSSDEVVNVHAPGLTSTALLKAAVLRESTGFRGFAESAEQDFLEERKTGQREFETALHQLQSLDATEEGKRLLLEIQQDEKGLREAAERGIAMGGAKNGREATVESERRDIILKRNELLRKLDVLTERKQHRLDEARAQSTARTGTARMWLVSVAVLAVVFGVVTALLLRRTLSRQIGSVVQHVQLSSTELQSTANQQASGAKQTASAMSEVTTTMSELLATSRQITESAQQVAHIADQTAAAARSGDQTVTKAQDAIEGIRRQVNGIVGHMLELGKRSQSIGLVLDIIGELAEQTNILSINATIEAVGAGEQGKRFAVVGDEIRKLADRVGGSTKDIRALVEEIQGAVNTTVLATETGSKAVDAGLHEFEAVTQGFKKIAELVLTTTQAAREIELSTKQQMSAVEQVNVAISGAAQASRETEASSAQNLQTATQLAHLSRDLSLIVQSRAA